MNELTIVASSSDLLGTATLLIDAGLAKLTDRVVIAPQLCRLDRTADPATFKAIARLLISRRPPDWLRDAVVNGRLVKEYVPEGDSKAIAWLGEDLEPTLVAAHHELYGSHDDRFLKALGDAGELAIVAALKAKEVKCRHVALISDRFGYDIEANVGHLPHGIEVKTAVSSTSDRVLLSRNEFDVAGRMGDRWRLVQVTLSGRSVVSKRVTTSDVERIRELSIGDLVGLAPDEGQGFRWMETAEFRPTQGLWRPSSLVVPTGFEVGLDLDVGD